MAKTLRVLTKDGWNTKSATDIPANRLTAEEFDSNFLELESQIEDRVVIDDLAADTGASLVGIGNGRTQADKNAEFVSIEDFGAVGDGVTSDATAFSSASTHLSESGGTLYLAAGKTYLNDVYAALTISDCAKTITIEGNGATIKGGIFVSNCKKIIIKNLTISTDTDTFPDYISALDTNIIEIKSCVFEGTTFYNYPSVQVYSVDECITERILIEDCTFSGDGILSTDPRHLNIRAAKAIAVTRCKMSGVNMKEFIKTSEYSANIVIDSLEATGSAEEEVFDAFTSYGPITIKDSIVNVTKGGIYSHKASGLDGYLTEVDFPIAVTIVDNDFKTANKSAIYCGGAYGLAWAGEYQSVSISNCKIICGDGGGSVYRAVDIRGTNSVHVSGNKDIGFVDSTLTPMYAVHLVGNDSAIIGDNIFSVGSIVFIAGNTTTGEAYSTGVYSRIYKNKFKSALGLGAVYVNTQPTLNLCVEDNSITINHAFADSTRPVYISGVVAMYQGILNFVEKLGASGSTSPIYSSLTNYISVLNTWDRRIIHANAAPTTGTWSRGDLVFRSFPSLGTNVGWICVSDGSPGTWAQFGGIETANSYTVTNPTTDRTLDVTGDTVAQVAAVLGTLIADLKTSGILKT